MKFAILLTLLISSPFSFAEEVGSNILSTPEEKCQDPAFAFANKKNVANIVTFEKIVKLKAGTYSIENVHLKSGSEFYRIKENVINRSRICKDLGYHGQAPGGTRIEFDDKETVVGINKNFKIIDRKRSEALFIKDLTCVK
jgi:hypothetical protein